jgi:hypothetical protein
MVTTFSSGIFGSLLFQKSGNRSRNSININIQKVEGMIRGEEVHELEHYLKYDVANFIHFEVSSSMEKVDSELINECNTLKALVSADDFSGSIPS